MQLNELQKKMEELKALQVKAAGVFNPFAKAAIAEKAVDVSIDLLDELVKREVARYGKA